MFEKAEFQRVDSIGTFFYIIFWQSFYLHISRIILTTCEIVYVMSSLKALYIKLYYF